MLDYLLLLLDLLRATVRGRRQLVAENLLLRQQLMVLTRPTRRRSRPRRYDKLFWVLARRLVDDWRSHSLLVRPETVVEVRELIATMARDNPTWDAERIRGELLKLGIVVSRRSVQRHRRGRPARPPSQSWRTFLANHRAQLWAADLLAVQTLTFRTLYVLLFVAHDRRQIVHLNVTAHARAAWVWRQLIEATPWGRSPRYLLRDRDAVYGRDFAAHARSLGIETVRTPVRAPRANAIAERVIGTLRRECLDHMIVLNEAHLRSVLAEYVRYYNAERPHRALELGTPIQHIRLATGPIRARPVLGGLHYTYQRAA